MAEYTAVKGDTMKSIAQLFFLSQSVAEQLCSINNLTGIDAQISEGTTITIPPRLYSVLSQQPQGDIMLISLSTLVKQDVSFPPVTDSPMVFYSPRQGKYLAIGLDHATSEITTLVREAQQIVNMAKRIATAWARTDIFALIDDAKKAGEELVSMLPAIAKDPKSALEELVVVKTNTGWEELPQRFFVRPDKLSAIIPSPAAWKSTGDALLQKILSEIPTAPPGCQAALTALSALTANVDALGSAPLDWKYAADTATAAAKNAFATTPAAAFLRFLTSADPMALLSEQAKKLQFSKIGNLDLSLASGSISGKWAIPSENGLNIFEVFGAPADMVCRIRLGLELAAHIYADVKIASIASLPNLSLVSGSAPTASGTATASATANLDAAVDITGTIDWSPESSGTFRNLALVDFDASVVANADAKVAISFKDANVRCSLPAAKIKGLAGKGSLVVDVKTDEAILLFEHLFNTVINHYKKMATDKASGVLKLLGTNADSALLNAQHSAEEIANAAAQFIKYFSVGKVVDGTASGTWYIPAKDGFDCVSLFDKVPPLKLLLKKDNHCVVRFKFDLAGYYFASASAQGSATGSASATPAQASTAGSSTGNASGSASGKCEAVVEWSDAPNGVYKTLGKILMTADADAQAAGAVKGGVGIHYKNKELKCALPLSIIPSLGGGSSHSEAIMFTASGPEAENFVNHLFSSLNLDLGGLGGLSLGNIGQKIGEGVKAVGNVATGAGNAVKGLFGK